MAQNNRPDINKENTIPIFESKFLNLYDFRYEEGKHYYNATRRSFDDLVVFKDSEAFKGMLPDAVTCVVVLNVKNVQDDSKQTEPLLLLSYEFRYPAGEYLLCPPAGIMDPEDKLSRNPLFTTAIREIKEETGIEVTADNAKLSIVNPLLFSTPGMTDESNGIVCAEVTLENLDMLTNDGAEGSEGFDGFELVNVSKAKELIRNGRDKNGNYYSVFTWIALTWFVANY